MRRVREEKAGFFLVSEEGNKIELEYNQFPDGEYYLRLVSPEEINNASLNFYATLNSSEDFVKILLTLGTLKQYGAKEINLTLKNWTPFSEEDYLIVSIFRIFAQKVSLLFEQSGEYYLLPINSIVPQEKKEGPLHIDHVAYLQPRFRETVEGAVSRLKEAESQFLEIKQIFPGHWKVSLPEKLSGKNIVIVHSTENSENILSLILTLSLLRLKGVNSISLINTYQGYSRQDKEFKEGEGVSAYILLEVLNCLLDKNFTINVHYGKRSGLVEINPEIWISEEEGYPKTIDILPPQSVYNLNGFVQLAEGLLREIEALKGKDEVQKPLLILSPDDGGFLYVQEAGEVLRERYGLNVISGYLNKERISATEVIISGEILTEGGKTLSLPRALKDYYIFILDDETSTGGTIKSAVYHLVNNLGADAEKIFAGVVQGKFSSGREEFYFLKDKEALPQLLVTLDTLPVFPGIKTISSAPLISFCIKRILGGL
ncbi:MAG: ribose-phosphate pyrophosphokinase-like domain-containing protein [Candidatus Omnitrophota bacterium]